jgi:hypothetical protein
MVYADSGHQVMEERDEMLGRGIVFRVAMRPGKLGVPSNTQGGVTV